MLVTLSEIVTEVVNEDIYDNEDCVDTSDVQNGEIEIDGTLHQFDFNFLLDKICMPMLFIILSLVVGRFLWRICFFGSGILVETNLRSKMFDHCKNLSQQYSSFPISGFSP